MSKYFAFILILLLCSCEDPPPVLSKADRNAVDTLVINRIKILRPKLDSICDARSDALVQNAVDSIMARRLQEINALLERSNE